MKLALGTAQFGLDYGVNNTSGQVTKDEARKMLSLSIQKGIKLIDTAISYGQSEMALGSIGTNGFDIVTKIPGYPSHLMGVDEWLIGQVESSFSRLGVTSIYAILLHRPIDLLGNVGGKLYSTLEMLKDTGKVQKVGVSIYSPDELLPLVSKYSLDIVQAPYNLIDRRLSKSGWLTRLNEMGTEVHTRSVFLQGLLLMDPTRIPEKFRPWEQIWNEWNNWIASADVTRLQACLSLPLKTIGIDRVVVGADNLNQLKQILDCAENEGALKYPELSCVDERLINPTNWAYL
ncbi:MAG: aldo/keto reductase [Candidatus Marinimicrobia bacterium]|nr:aldo/keto reductase [Candidatus Neomarinimicrobiota bacterium]